MIGEFSTRVMKEIWIIGSGRFGSLAYQRLSKIFKNTYFVLIDSVKKNFLEGNDRELTFEQADGIEFLKENLSTSNCPDWIIPAVPLHLAAEWILARLGARRIRRLNLPHEIDPLLPNPVRGTDGSIYVSHADFLCPDDCSEPSNICTMTRKKRKKTCLKFLRTCNCLHMDRWLFEVTNWDRVSGDIARNSFFRWWTRRKRQQTIFW